ncbi:VWA domain-containing protein [Campylobacter sp. RM15925]|uniref:vWA domain-containing protein n=1 Tax=Campylobacter sp. RM15925 TaxID=1705724 RepID=UPI0014753A0E|nr:VWA domain-containing protein [Campylobacter sp. RM15925]
MSFILEDEDLVNNPKTRLPVAMCLDISGSMAGEAILELQRGVEYFFEAIKNDIKACNSVELAIITFDSEVELVVDFSSIENQQPPFLEAGGATSMGQAVELALGALDSRKKMYSDNGVDYYQPWLIIITDGEPTDSIERSVKYVQSLIDKKKLTTFPIGVGRNVNYDTLKKYGKNGMVLKVENSSYFREFFVWLSQSVSQASQSTPGDKIRLPNLPSKGIEIDM